VSLDEAARVLVRLVQDFGDSIEDESATDDEKATARRVMDWLASLMRAGRNADGETERLCAALAAASEPVVLVANEVGLGIVPENALARAFRDAAGRLNQRVASMADRVVLLAAGLPMLLKDPALLGQRP